MFKPEDFVEIKITKRVTLWGVLSKTLRITVTAGDQSAWGNRLIERGVPEKAARDVLRLIVEIAEAVIARL
jgi:hypothetical protein